ncbi:hypothetical protein V6N13_079326 [Hibiscus sabdariffa]
MREPSMLVRETATEKLEERQHDWAYLKSGVVIDIIWNMAFLVVSVSVFFSEQGREARDTVEAVDNWLNKTNK